MRTKDVRWDDSTAVADWGNDDQTAVAIFHIEKNVLGETIKIERVKHFKKGTPGKKIRIWIRRMINRLKKKGR